MFCSSCGQQNEDGARFCESCGQLLTNEPQIQQPVQQGSQQSPPGYYGTPPTPSATQGYSAAQTPPAVYSIYGQAAIENAAPAAPRMKKPVNRALIIVGAAAAVLIIAGIVLFNIGSRAASPQTVALNIFRSVYSKDYSTLYDTVDITPGDFTGKSTFEYMMKKTASSEKLGKLLSCSVVSTKKSVKNKKTVETVNIKFKLSSQTSAQTASMDLIEQSGKKWLFFDSWKLSSEGLLAGTYTVNVPKGASVYLDNIKVGSKYLSKASDPTDNSQSYFDVYVLKNVFSGDNDIKITSPYTKDFTDTLGVSDGDSYTPDNVELSDSAANSLSDTAQEDLGKIYTAAIAQNSFDSVKSLFTADSAAQNSGGDTYTEIGEDLNDYYGYDQVKNISFSNVEILNPEVEDNGAVYADVGFDYVYTIDETDYLGGTTEFTQTTPQSNSAKMEFVYVNGKWEMSGLDDPYLYFPMS